MRRLWNYLKRQRTRVDLAEFKSLIAAPDTTGAFGITDTDTLTLPAPGHLAIRPAETLGAGNFEISTGDGGVWENPDVVADRVDRVTYVEEGEVVTIENLTGAYVGLLEVGVVDGNGVFRTIWELTCV